MEAKKAKTIKSPRNQLVSKGGVLPPSAIVMHFSPNQWEDFIEVACTFRELEGKKYVQVKRLGNAGDAGRDIEARFVPQLLTDEWDLYQAKHYGNRLTPGDAFFELTKFFVNLSQEVFPRPRRYYFCSPQNAGPDLHDLIANPSKFKQRLLADWASGATGLKTRVALLTPEVKALVEAFDFSRIEEFLVRDLIKCHEKNTKEHHQLFGIVPSRGDDPEMPAAPALEELVYINELLRVYSEHCSKELTMESVLQSDDYRDHLSDARSLFYCAEGLRRFSRDLYTDQDEFNVLLVMLLQGIKPSVFNLKHKTGMDKLNAAIDKVSSVSVTDSVLHSRLRGGDLPGACHHLANESMIKWIK
jgi:hypothetical protein